jgi:hypothetical protein
MRPGLYSPIGPDTLLEQAHRNTISPLSLARLPTEREALRSLRLGIAPGLLYASLQRAAAHEPLTKGVTRGSCSYAVIPPLSVLRASEVQRANP